MVVVFPVSGFVRHTVEIDALNTGTNLVCVPVCIQSCCYKPLLCVSNTFYDLNHLSRQRLCTREAVRAIDASSYPIHTIDYTHHWQVFQHPPRVSQQSNLEPRKI